MQILEILYRVKGRRKEFREALYLVITIMMVPIFAVVSYLGLIELHESKKWYFQLLECVKECYEAVVIYFFLQQLYSIAEVRINILDDEIHFPFSIAYALDKNGQPIPKSTKLENRKLNEIHHVPPFNWFLNHWKVDSSTIKNLHWWTLQQVIIRPLLSIEEFSCYYFNYSEGICGPTSLFVNTIVLNVSITVAVTALLIFKHALQEQIKKKRPLQKFLCIKGVVFISFFQGLIIDFLIEYEQITAQHFYELEELSEGIQCFLNLVEMGLIFTLANLFSFDPHEQDDCELHEKIDVAVQKQSDGSYLRDLTVGGPETSRRSKKGKRD